MIAGYIIVYILDLCILFEVALSSLLRTGKVLLSCHTFRNNRQDYIFHHRLVTFLLTICAKRSVNRPNSIFNDFLPFFRFFCISVLHTCEVVVMRIEHSGVVWHVAGLLLN